MHAHAVAVPCWHQFAAQAWQRAEPALPATRHSTCMLPKFFCCRCCTFYVQGHYKMKKEASQGPAAAPQGAAASTHQPAVGPSAESADVAAEGCNLPAGAGQAQLLRTRAASKFGSMQVSKLLEVKHVGAVSRSWGRMPVQHCCPQHCFTARSHHAQQLCSMPLPCSNGLGFRERASLCAGMHAPFLHIAAPPSKMCLRAPAFRRR